MEELGVDDFTDVLTMVGLLYVQQNIGLPIRVMAAS
jgi:hypothetical protein